MTIAVTPEIQAAMLARKIDWVESKHAPKRRAVALVGCAVCKRGPVWFTNERREPTAKEVEADALPAGHEWNADKTQVLYVVRHANAFVKTEKGMAARISLGAPYESWDHLAGEAYYIADAMIRERNKK